MARRFLGLMLILLVGMSSAMGTSTADATTAPTTGPVFDDFPGPAGAGPNPRYWSFDIGSSATMGWERGSLQTYTDSTDNVHLDGQGNLIIEAVDSGGKYTSGRLTTRGKVDMGYGLLTARIKFPSGQGIWPAFWMLGSNEAVVGWPQCGEIDMMELINAGTRYHVNLHGPSADIESSGPIADLAAGFHDYWMRRSSDSISIGVDGTTLGSFTPASLPPGAPWVFNEPMYALLNVAVGGDWPGPPDASTQFPATMVVDWFRFDPDVI